MGDLNFNQFQKCFLFQYLSIRVFRKEVVRAQCCIVNIPTQICRRDSMNLVAKSTGCYNSCSMHQCLQVVGSFPRTSVQQVTQAHCRTLHRTASSCHACRFRRRSSRSFCYWRSFSSRPKRIVRHGENELLRYMSNRTARVS